VLFSNKDCYYLLLDTEIQIRCVLHLERQRERRMLQVIMKYLFCFEVFVLVLKW